MDLNDYKIDTEKTSEGVWVPLDGSTRLKIKRFNNKAFNRILRSLSAPYKNQISRGTLDPDIQGEILTKAISKEILVDWEGLKLDGEQIPYSQEKAFDILSNPVFADFRDEVVQFSQDISLFRSEDIEDIAEK